MDQAGEFTAGGGGRILRLLRRIRGGADMYENIKIVAMKEGL